MSGAPHGRCLEDRHANENTRKHVSIEPGTVGVYVQGEHPLGDQATVVIAWDQAVEVSRRILQLARDHGDVR